MMTGFKLFLGDLNLNQVLTGALQWRNKLTHGVSYLSMDPYEYCRLLLFFISKMCHIGSIKAHDEICACFATVCSS